MASVRPPRSADLSCTTRSTAGSAEDQNHRNRSVRASAPARTTASTHAPGPRGSGALGFSPSSATEELLRLLRRLGPGHQGDDALERLLGAPVVLQLLVGVVDAEQRLLVVAGAGVVLHQGLQPAHHRLPLPALGVELGR